MNAKTCATVLVIMSLLAGAPAGAETIYRCYADDGGITFSDRPCGESQQHYQPRRRLSIVAAAPDLETTMTRNRALIDQRRERSRPPKSRLPSTQQPPRESVVPDRAHQSLVVFPVWPGAFPIQPDHDAGDDNGNTSPEKAKERFSALSGPFPGARRRPDNQ